MEFTYVLVAIFLCSCSNTQAKTRVDFSMDKFNQLPSTKKSVLSFHGLKIIRYNRTHQAFKGSVVAFIDVDNNVTFSADAFKNEGNGKVKSPFRFQEEGVCDFMVKDKAFFKDLFLNSDLPPITSCPVFPKGNYTVNEFMFDPMNIPEVFNGKFHFMLKFFYQKEVVDQIQFDCQIFRYALGSL